MPKREFKQKINANDASTYVVTAALALSVTMYAAYTLLTHHQEGSCSDTRTSLYPQFAIPMLIVALWILLKCIQYNYAVGHPKYTYKGLSKVQVVIVSILLCIFSIVAIFINNFCIPF